LAQGDTAPMTFAPVASRKARRGPLNNVALRLLDPDGSDFI